MAALSQDRASIVRALIEAAPDSAVHSLDVALRGAGAAGSLSSVKSIVVQEKNDRLVRDSVFEPIVPLFSPRLDGYEQRLFPKPALAQLWRALKIERPNEADYAASLAARRYQEDAIPPIYDELCVLAARGLRAEKGAFASVAALLREARPGADVDLIAYLDLAPIARRTIRQLHVWIGRASEEQQAAARLAFRDAAVIADDSGPRLMEVLHAHLAEPWVILRVTAAVMLKPTDRFAASSELADFGARLLRDIDRRVGAIKAFDYAGGAEAGCEAAASLRIAAAVAQEFEQRLNVSREGPWGEQLAKQKKLLAAAAESHLKKTAKVVGDALPQHTLRIAGRSMKPEAQLDTPPDAQAVRRATAVLTFFAGLRAVASQNGYGVMRAKVQEEVGLGLEAYLEDLLQTLHTGETDHLDNARLYLDVAADLAALVYDDQYAQTIRRRAAAAAA